MSEAVRLCELDKLALRSDVFTEEQQAGQSRELRDALLLEICYH